MTDNKIQPTERRKEERFSIPFNDREICVDYQVTKCLDNGELVLLNERCRVSSVNPKMYFWLVSSFGDKKTLRHEYSKSEINPKALAVLRDRLPDYVCNVLPELGQKL